MTENPSDYYLDLERGELFLGDMSCELTTRDFHRELRKEFVTTIGNVVKTMFYEIGKITGNVLAEHFDDINILSKMGWGFPVVQKEVVKIKNSYLSSGIRSEEPVCEILG